MGVGDGWKRAEFSGLSRVLNSEKPDSFSSRIIEEIEKGSQ